MKQPCEFFFCWYGDPRDLHSFPTRRSSDLLDCGAIGPGHPFGRHHSGSELPYDGFPHRSEEHTSELQSQSNLVCRLLLEKKNSRGNPMTARMFSRTIPTTSFRWPLHSCAGC